MDLNHLLLWTTATTVLVGVGARLNRHRRGERGWLVALLLVLLATVAGLVWAPGRAGYLGGAALFLLVVGPLLLFRGFVRLIHDEQFGVALHLSRLLALLHPADGWTRWPALVTALAAVQRGELAAAERRLSSLAARPDGPGSTARAWLCRVRGDWTPLLQPPSDPALPGAPPALREAELAPYLRALAETGRLAEALAGYVRHEATVQRMSATTRNTLRLALLAFGGRVEAVQRLLAGPLDELHPSTRQFWLGAAEVTAGLATGQVRHEALRQRGLSGLPLALRQRLSSPLPVGDDAASGTGPGAAGAAVLDRIERELAEEERYGEGGRRGWRSMPVTWALVGLNLAYYLAEALLGLAGDAPRLYLFGAFSPRAVLDGEWWRLLTALFLHFDVLHLGMNLLALLWIGPTVERALGSLRQLLIYLIAGVGGMLGLTVLFALSGGAEKVYLGASGCVMGLIGATAGLLLVGWRRHAATVARRRLRGIALIIGLQLLFDLSTPQIAVWLHVSGLVLGFIVGGLFAWRTTATPVARGTR